jgi:hypothetical protein
MTALNGGGLRILNASPLEPLNPGILFYEKIDPL